MTYVIFHVTFRYSGPNLVLYIPIGYNLCIMYIYNTKHMKYNNESYINYVYNYDHR